MITLDGWVSWAVIAPGIPDKIYTQRNAVSWITLHSMVGKTEGAVGRLMSTERDANGRYTAYAAASVHFLLDQDGTLIQMYSLYDSCWASGTRQANTSSVAIELEGGNYPNYSEPMTDAQVATAIRLIREIAALRGWEDVRKGVYLHEHNEFQATACPSGRWARLYEAFEEDDMTPDEVRAIVREEIQAEAERGGAGSFAAFIEAVTKRIGAIHEATDLTKIPGE